MDIKYFIMLGLLIGITAGTPVSAQSTTTAQPQPQSIGGPVDAFAVANAKNQTVLPSAPSAGAPVSEQLTTTAQPQQQSTGGPVSDFMETMQAAMNANPPISAQLTTSQDKPMNFDTLIGLAMVIGIVVGGGLIAGALFNAACRSVSEHGPSPVVGILAGIGLFIYLLRTK